MKRVFGVFVGAIVTIFATGSTITPPDPLTQIRYAIGSAVVLFPLFLYLAFAYDDPLAWENRWRRLGFFSVAVIVFGGVFSTVLEDIAPQGAGWIWVAAPALLGGVVAAFWLVYRGGYAGIRSVFA